MKSRLDSLSEKLNSRTKYQEPGDSRQGVPPQENQSVPEDWETGNIDDLLMADRRKPEAYPLMKKIFMVSVLFAICAGIAAGLIYLKGDNFISTRNLEIEIEGPVSISAGSSVEIEVTITNKNNAALDKVNMSIIYPDGTRKAENPTEELNNTKEALEELGPGDKISKNVRAIFLGSQGEVKKVRVSVDYRVKGSNATFTKDKIFELTIGSAPVTVSITRPEEVVSGEEFSTTVSIIANSEETLQNVILRAEYPYGFSQKGATPAAFDKERAHWLLGDLSPGEKKTIILRGTLLGEDDEERTFRFFVGVGDGSSVTFDTVLSSDSMVIAIDRPLIALRLRINGESQAEYIAPAGQEIQGSVSFTNNLSENLINPQVEVVFSGPVDRSSIAPTSGGFYNSGTNSIVWSTANTEGLRTLAPGDSGTLSFRFRSQASPIGLANQKIDLVTTISGRQQNSVNNLRVSESGSIKIASETSLIAKSLYSRGPIGNSGPIPPKAETETSYTVSLSVTNTRNELRDVKVTALLGPNVDWGGEVLTDNSEVVYDPNSKAVSWNIGILASSTGFSTPTREIFFKVKLIPSLGQVGGVPVLINNIALTGQDSFTNMPVRITHQPVTTKISTDPRYVQGDETVVK